MSGGASQPSRKASYSRPLTQSLSCSAKVTTRRRRRRTGNVHTQKKIANENEIKRRKCKYIHTHQKEKARKIEGDGERVRWKQKGELLTQTHCLWGVFYSFPPQSRNNEQHKKLCIKIFAAAATFSLAFPLQGKLNLHVTFAVAFCRLSRRNGNGTKEGKQQRQQQQPRCTCHQLQLRES